MLILVSCESVSTFNPSTVEIRTSNLFNGISIALLSGIQTLLGGANSTIS